MVYVDRESQVDLDRRCRSDRELPVLDILDKSAKEPTPTTHSGHGLEERDQNAVW